tara:strand:- start:1019 stop:1537 length:519 start_codon:yes stop_codon:yes gene_type:complete
MVKKKSHELGGHRSAVRHGSELGVGAALALLVVSFLPDGWVDAFQSNLLSVVLTGGFSTAAKLLDAKGLLPGIAKSGLVLIMAGTISGCALTVGTVDPEEFTGVQGETIIACEIKGFSLAVGDGGTCRTVEGGNVSQGFVGMVTGLVESVGRILSGVFGGIGSAFSGMAGGE